MKGDLSLNHQHTQ